MLFRKKPRNTVSALIAGDHIWSNITSYAKDFAETRRPPFIHNHALTDQQDGYHLNTSGLPEPLANCASIVPMFLTKTPQSTPFVLRTIFQEVERLCNEVRTSIDAHF